MDQRLKHIIKEELGDLGMYKGDVSTRLLFYSLYDLHDDRDALLKDLTFLRNQRIAHSTRTGVIESYFIKSVVGAILAILVAGLLVVIKA